MVPLFKARDFLNNVYYSIWGHQGEKLQFIDCPQWMAERIGIRWKESERHFIHSLFQVFQVHHFLITRKDQKPIYMSDVYPSPQCSCHLSMMLYCSGPVLNVSTRNNWAAVKLHIHVWIKNIFAYFSYGPFSSVQFSSVAQSCQTLWDHRNRSMPGLPVHHQLPESTQTHVHWVSDAI